MSDDPAYRLVPRFFALDSQGKGKNETGVTGTTRSSISKRIRISRVALLTFVYSCFIVLSLSFKNQYFLDKISVSISLP